MSISEYQCPECGAVSSFRAVDCCDDCILKFFFEDVNAPAFEEKTD
jgi:hypothetical protein